MNRNELVTLLQLDRGMRIVQVKFLSGVYEGEQGKAAKPSGRLYHYKVLPDLDVDVGDMVVAQTYQHASVAEVTGVFTTIPAEMEPDMRLRYVVGKVDLSAAKEQEAEEQAAYNQLSRAEVKAKLDSLQTALGMDLSTISLPSLDAAKRPSRGVTLTATGRVIHADVSEGAVIDGED